MLKSVVLLLCILVLPDLVNSEQVKLTKANSAVFRYFGFKIYTLSIYKDSSVEDVKDWIRGTGTAVPIALRILYHRDFSAKDFIISGRKLISQNKTVKFDEIEKILSQFESFYLDINKGDNYLLIFNPEVGLSLLKNGVELGSINNDEFARAYLGIWLSEYSVSPSVTAQLLPDRAKNSPSS